ncbi:hypothetical protein M569_12223 [Genlisea aurea]|uniref:Uncharacterized protein n=1 Tax=Genlisea aurea TaxID=192259 RepID=S8DRX5_9LAMI|nr:hypothetical protein M569_12223 [Genlisea aurea]
MLPYVRTDDDRCVGIQALRLRAKHDQTGFISLSPALSKIRKPQFNLHEKYFKKFARN